MLIRQTRTSHKATGEGYVTYRLVRTERIGGKVRQITVLNLGRHFPIKSADWLLLCCRLEQLLNPQALIMPLECSESIERAAQRYHAQLVARAPRSASPVDDAAGPVGEARPPADFQASILGNLIGRMGQPGSERATWNWLQQHSALGELIDVDFLSMSHMSLCRASDVLMKHREVIETRLFRAAQTLFDLQETATLYDLSNTYFEGEAERNGQVKRGRSKEKRSDCPLVTLGLALDGSGFVRRSQTIAGNVSEPASMLAGLGTSAGALVVMNAGVATDANVAWLVEHGYRYLVVRRGGRRQFDATRSVSIETAGEQGLHLQKELSPDGQELSLYGRPFGETAAQGRGDARAILRAFRGWFAANERWAAKAAQRKEPRPAAGTSRPTQAEEPRRQPT